MCLDRIDGKKKDWRVGYKVMISRPGWYHPPYYDAPMRKGRWYKDKNDTPVVSCGIEKYKPGFHFFRNKKDALKDFAWSQCVLKIRVRKLTATGRQWGCKAGVAREIYLEKIVE